jgi:hypothetical protein
MSATNGEPAAFQDVPVGPSDMTIGFGRAVTATIDGTRTDLMFRFSTKHGVSVFFLPIDQVEAVIQAMRATASGLSLPGGR